MNNIDNNVARQKNTANNNQLLKNVLYNAGISHENFRNNYEPELHPVSNLKQTKNTKLYALVNNMTVYSVDPLQLN